MKKLIVGLLAVLMMLPVLAFAEDSHQIPELNLVSGDHSGKTLEHDGYTWDEDSAVLTLKNISATNGIILPKRDCTINIQGSCYAGVISRPSSADAQSLTICGAEGADLSAAIDVAGDLTLDGLTMTSGEIRNASVNLAYKLTLKNSTINLYNLGWMTDAGIDLQNSKLHVVLPVADTGSQFWVEMIAMDEKSEIVSLNPLSNYGKRDLADFGNVLNYVAEPVSGFFVQTNSGVENQNPISIYTKVEGDELMKADHFVLRAPTGGGEEIPGDGGTEAGPGGTTDTGTGGGSQAGTGEKSPATGDGGLLLYGGAALLSMSAAAVLLSRKKRERK